MPNRVVIGTQWGDEGKGKVVDILSETSDIVARCQGGANAGHTVIIGDRKFVLHLIPSGILHPGSTCLIGNGVVLDIEQFFSEIDQLNSEGINTSGRLFVSGLTHLVLPYHKWAEQFNEEELGASKIGTTLRGIGPAYTDKCSRSGIRVFDMFFPDKLREKLEINFRIKAGIISRFSSEEHSNIDTLHKWLVQHGERRRDMVVDASQFMHDACRDRKSMLFEGAQVTLLDIDFGTFPFVTSSNTTIGGIMTGIGVPPCYIDETYGVVKAYTTRVGSGPFPTELTDDAGKMLGERGAEFGATTGRPRRCGWLDLKLLKRSVDLNGVDYLALTKLDVLDDLPEIKVCVDYKIDSSIRNSESFTFYDLGNVEPVYKTFNGWMQPISGVTNFQELPMKAREYINFIEEFTGAKIALISTGPSREETILMPPIVRTNGSVVYH